MKESRNYYIWAIAVTLWMTLCFIVPYFVGLPANGLVGLLSKTAYIAACGIGTFFVIACIGSSRWTNAVLLPLLTILGAALSFYLIGYKTTLTPMLLEVILHTNTEEALGVVSWQAVAWVALQLGIAGLFVWYRWTRICLPFPWAHAAGLLALGLVYFFGNARLQNSLCQRFPYNIPYTLHEYFKLQQSIQVERSTPPYEVVSTPDSLTVVLILGEAARADHLQLNGYTRPTTPRLAARRNLVSYPHIYSEQTHTLASLPHILTRADSIHDEYQYTERSFTSILKQEGYNTYWISNQDIESTVSPFMSECDTLIFANAGKSVYVFSNWLDADLLPIMQTLHRSGEAHSLYILHTIGSHWYYNNHVPDSMQRFQPVTNNKVVTANSREQLVNSYDNTILYMDYFVDAVISSVEQENALVIYQADHSEALGEDGEYLHANDTEWARMPACVIWYSDKYAAANPDKIKALVANKDKRYRTDYVFYSILSAAGIEADGNNEAFDIFR